MAELYINGERADLPPNAEVAMTYQAFDLGEIGNRKSDRSNSFSLPLTHNNNRIFEAAADTNTADAPYEVLNATLFQDGIDVSQGGRLVLRDVNNSYNTVIYSGNFKWAEKLKQKSLNELDLSAFDHQWNITEIITNGGNSRTTGYVYALVDYGDLATSPTDVYVERHPPCMYVHTLIEQMFTDIGMTVTGGLLTDPFYLKMVVPTTVKELRSPRYALESSFKVNNNGANPQSESDFPSGSNVRFSQVVTDGQNGYNNTTFQYTVQQGFEGVIRAEMDVLPIFVTNNSFTFDLLVNGAVRATRTLTQGVADEVNGEQFILTTLSDTFNIGDTMSIRWTGQGNFDQIILGADSFFESVPSERLVYDGEVNCENLLPDMPQADLLLSVLRIFGCFIQVDGNKVRLEMFKDLVSPTAKANALDWSDKVVKKPGQLKWYAKKGFKWGNYGQKSWLKWKETDEVPNGYGDGYFEIDNVNLPASVDLFELPFAASEQSLVFNTYTGALVRRYALEDSVWTQQDEVTPRLLFVEDLAVNPVDYFDDVAASTAFVGTLKLAKFIDQFTTGGQGLGFNQNVISNYYSEVVEALDKAEDYDAYLNLGAVDVQALDFFKLVYLRQADSYFLVNAVKQFIEGQLTKCELIKI